MSKPRQKKPAKTVNAKEIKAWLRGILEFQSDEWTPSAEQWATIREKIFNLEENESPSQQVAYETDYGYRREPEPTYTPVLPNAQPIPAYSALSAPMAHAPAPVPDSGRIAVAQSPTESGVVSASNRNTVLEGEYKSGFA